MRPPDALQLESLCAELDPEVAAALSTHLGPAGLSQEMDFLLWLTGRTFDPWGRQETSHPIFNSHFGVLGRGVLGDVILA